MVRQIVAERTITQCRSIMRSSLAFFLVSISAWIFAVAGSILGGSLLSQTGLFLGAILLGTLGVILAGLITRRSGLIAPSGFRTATIGGVLGFLIASVSAVYGSQTFNTAVIPVLSVCLVGLGFLLGARHRRRA